MPKSNGPVTSRATTTKHLLDIVRHDPAQCRQCPWWESLGAGCCDARGDDQWSVADVAVAIELARSDGYARGRLGLPLDDAGRTFTERCRRRLRSLRRATALDGRPDLADLRRLPSTLRYLREAR